MLYNIIRNGTRIITFKIKIIFGDHYCQLKPGVYTKLPTGLKVANLWEETC